MAKLKGKVNKSRKIALIVNPVTTVILIIMLVMGTTMGALASVAVIGYGTWAYFLFQANKEDKAKRGGSTKKKRR